MKNTIKYQMLLATLLLTASTPLTAMKKFRHKLPSLRKSKPTTYGTSHKRLGLPPTKSFEQKLNSYPATKGLISQPQARRAPQVSLWKKFKTRIRYPKSYKSRMATYQQQQSPQVTTGSWAKTSAQQWQATPTAQATGKGQYLGAQRSKAVDPNIARDPNAPVLPLRGSVSTAPAFPARPKHGPAGTKGMRPRSGSAQPSAYTPAKTAWQAGKVDVGAIMATGAGTGYTMTNRNPAQAVKRLPSRQDTGEIKVATMKVTTKPTLTPITQQQYPQIQKAPLPKIRITKQVVTPTIPQVAQPVTTRPAPPVFTPFEPTLPAR